ncbi:MAG: heavy-metal-associated domain-containing protein [Bacteroidetes bacterium]|nr:heavy-metal-associated domain-containing protein [Bacteroidota bacterium]MCH7769545.1 heavy-metal-associated domain-containing protein [Bacteroidota bacterium]MCH9029366.1 heavy-metal-associated domain-containing protein [Bacteroidota bacterium]
MKHALKMLIILFSIGISTSLAQSDEVKVRVDGLSCPFCAYGLEKKLNDLDGVESINIDLEEGLVTMQVIDGEKISEEDIKTKIKEAGFTPKEIVFSKKNNEADKKE